MQLGSSDPAHVVTLRHGVKVPILGLGTTHHGGYVHDTVVFALQQVGYRHVDTARRYGVERFIGRAIKDSGLARDQIFLTTKVWPLQYGRAAVQQAAQQSMDNLDTDYLDMLMLHLPVCPAGTPDPKAMLQDAWRGLELLLDADKTRCIGVSNFQQPHLLDLMEACSVVPHVNQCEFHPYQNPAGLLDFCHASGIAFEGHCPLAKGRLLQEQSIVQLAQRLGRTAAQVLIRWSIQHAVITIPKSTDRQRVQQNFEALDFQLDDKDMAFLDGLHRDLRVIDVDSFQSRLDAHLPDGYKMHQYRNQLPRLDFTST